MPTILDFDYLIIQDGIYISGIYPTEICLISRYDNLEDLAKDIIEIDISKSLTLYFNNFGDNPIELKDQLKEKYIVECSCEDIILSMIEVLNAKMDDTKCTCGHYKLTPKPLTKNASKI